MINIKIIGTGTAQKEFLAHWGDEKMAKILHTIWDAFSLMKIS